MARSDPQLNIRIPLELKERVELAAKESGRSVTSEILKRLEASLAVGEGLEALTKEQATLVNGMIAQLKQANSEKAENKSLTYPLDM